MYGYRDPADFVDLQGLGLDEEPSTYVPPQPTPTPTPAPSVPQYSGGMIYDPQGYKQPVQEQPTLVIQYDIAAVLSKPCATVTAREMHNAQTYLDAGKVAPAHVAAVKAKLAKCSRGPVAPALAKPATLPTWDPSKWTVPQTVKPAVRPVSVPSSTFVPSKVTRTVVSTPVTSIDYSSVLEEAEQKRTQLAQQKERELAQQRAQLQRVRRLETILKQPYDALSQEDMDYLEEYAKDLSLPVAFRDKAKAKLTEVVNQEIAWQQYKKRYEASLAVQKAQAQKLRRLKNILKQSYDSLSQEDMDYLEEYAMDLSIPESYRDQAKMKLTESVNQEIAQQQQELVKELGTGPLVSAFGPTPAQRAIEPAFVSEAPMSAAEKARAKSQKLRRMQDILKQPIGNLSQEDRERLEEYSKDLEVASHVRDILQRRVAQEQEQERQEQVSQGAPQTSSLNERLSQLKAQKQDLESRIRWTQDELKKLPSRSVLDVLLKRSPLSPEQENRKRALNASEKMQQANWRSVSSEIDAVEKQIKRQTKSTNVFDTVLDLLELPSKVSKGVESAAKSVAEVKEKLHDVSSAISEADTRAAEFAGSQVEKLQQGSKRFWDEFDFALGTTVKAGSKTFRDVMTQTVGAGDVGKKTFNEVVKSGVIALHEKFGPEGSAIKKVSHALDAFESMFQRGMAEVKKAAPVIGAALREAERQGITPESYRVAYEEGEGVVEMAGKPVATFAVGDKNVRITPASFSPFTQALTEGAVRQLSQREKGQALDLNFVGQYLNLQTGLREREWSPQEVKAIEREIKKLKNEVVKRAPREPKAPGSNATENQKLKYLADKTQYEIAQRTKQEVISKTDDLMQVAAWRDALFRKPWSSSEDEQDRLAQQLYNAYRYREFHNNIVDNIAPRIASEVAAEQLPGKEIVVGF